MSAAAFLDVCTLVALGFLSLALLLCAWRLIRGPALADRILALDTMTTLGIGIVAVIAVRSGIHLYLDIAIAVGLVGFLSTVALARYLFSRSPASAAAETGEASE